MTQARWLLPEDCELQAGALDRDLSIGLPAARVLTRRGIRGVAAARRFLNPALADLHEPSALSGLDDAVARLRRAIFGGEKVLIYGDYDVDGITSVVVLKKCIEMAGGLADFHVPHRLRDGYGMRPEVVEAAAQQGIRLIVSVDTGIRAAKVVESASALGIDVIITDHHLPDQELPPALAVLNPNRRDCLYPEKNLCGVGVAFKLVQALLRSLAWPADKLSRVLESFLKLVAIGTVADVVPLTGENRIIVKHGLSGLGTVRNPGLRALLDVAGFSAGTTPTAGQVAFRIAPRVNAAGRMDTAMQAIELFLTESPSRAREIAAQLNALNEERQGAEAAIVQSVLDQCVSSPVTDSHAALVFAGEGWHRGVLGIVASRMVERHHRPAFVLSVDRELGLARGSGRSIAAFHLLGAMESMPDLFTQFGGHEHAAGLTMSADRVSEFRERFNSYAAARLTPEDYVPTLQIDASVDFAEVDERTVGGILKLGPFGSGNPAPVFAAYDVELAGPPVVWKEKHLRLALRQSGRTFFVKAWTQAGRCGELSAGCRIDVALAFEEDAWSAARGYQNWAAQLRDFRVVG